MTLRCGRRRGARWKRSPKEGRTMAVVRVMCRSAQREQVLAVADQRGEPSPDVEWLVADDKDAELRHAPLADAIMTSRDTEVIDAAPRCRWVQVGSAGVDSVDMTQLNERGIELTNAAVIYGPALADHNMALILAWSRQLPFLFEAQQRGVWESRSNFPAGELAEQTILIVGLGGAGTMTAARAKGFGMHVIGTRRRADEPLPPCVDEQFDSSRETLHELLPSADWVALCCGLNDETYHLFDAEVGV
jgi:D-3-phosphoglycerate dehydrogenase